MAKINFTWSEQFGQYELVFTANNKEYTYKTYDGYLAKRIIHTAQRQRGTAWNMAKQLS